jgi:NADPH-dependent ferric siderophore reductase
MSTITNRNEDNRFSARIKRVKLDQDMAPFRKNATVDHMSKVLFVNFFRHINVFLQPKESECSRITGRTYTSSQDQTNRRNIHFKGPTTLHVPRRIQK